MTSSKKIYFGTVTLTRYKENDDLVYRTLLGLSQQTDVHLLILFYDQSPSPFFSQKIQNLSNHDITFKIIPLEQKGLSYARNKALQDCDHRLPLLYIDSDAKPEKDWAYHMLSSFEQENTAIVGSKILPDWESPPPFYIKSKIILEQYSLLDLGETEKSVEKVIGAGFGIHPDRLGNQAYFDESYGRINGKLFGGEETDLCQRAQKKGLNILYQGKAIVHHKIENYRISFGWVSKRLFYAGRSKALRSGKPKPVAKPILKDYIMALPFIPLYIGGYVTQKILTR